MIALYCPICFLLKYSRLYKFTLSLVLCCLFTFAADSQEQFRKKPVNTDATLQFEPLHTWRPPFGLDRVGRPVDIVVSLDSSNFKTEQFQIVAYRQGKELRRQNLTFTKASPYLTRETLPESADEIALLKRNNKGEWIELARKKPTLPDFECEASARPEKIIHPIDMGVIMVPANRLLLAGGQKAFVDIALISRTRRYGSLEIQAWYASDPGNKQKKKIDLSKNRKLQTTISLPKSSATLKQDVLLVYLKTSHGTEIWKKEIKVMLVPQLPETPDFGVVKTKLRYDIPIINIVDGKNKPGKYEEAWSPEKEDYVVFLPNGSRWVFWRGASYIPVWMSKYNTGLSYEWAERISPNEGFTDCPEPLMDKDLRYGSVEIIESTSARIHIRWSYQSCDFNYKVNGDFAQEDYYFYPDGLGTRVLTLTSLPEAEYEVAEFILLAPPAALPFEIMPEKPMTLISYRSGKKSELSLPEKDSSWRTLNDPVIYRMKLHRNDPMTAFSFNPLLQKKPFAFQPFYDKGMQVTPAYWGGHWPLSQGFNTGRAINESIWSAPSHNSLITWGAARPEPVRSKLFETHDAMGVVKKMKEETWVWLIGMTDATDDILLQTAKSYAQPPLLAVEGALQEPNGYNSERRALLLIAEDKKISITIQPQSWCINPVFEIRHAPKNLKKVKLDGTLLSAGQYAWDGYTLWVNASFSEKRKLELEFGD